MIPKTQALVKATQVVQYLTPEEVLKLVNTALQGRNGRRNALLITVLFQAGLRISEALSLTPKSIEKFEGRPVLKVIGKGNKPRSVSIPQSLEDKLKAYAFEKSLSPNSKFFDIKRCRAFGMLREIAQRAGIQKKIYPHLLRHSHSIEVLRQTGNPKALQISLGHSSLQMTMRYLSTLAAEDSLRIMGEVKFEF